MRETPKIHTFYAILSGLLGAAVGQVVAYFWLLDLIGIVLGLVVTLIISWLGWALAERLEQRKKSHL